jgi:hypothetical protein
MLRCAPLRQDPIDFTTSPSLAMPIALKRAGIAKHEVRRKRAALRSALTRAPL